MIKVIKKGTDEVVMISKTYFNNHKTHFDVYVEKVEKPKVVKTRKKKPVAVPKKVEVADKEE